MNDIEWGVTVHVDNDANLVYIYGQQKNTSTHTFDPYVARCSLDNILGPWEYWDGNGWTDNVFSAKTISNFPAAPSYSVIKLENGKYYMIAQENGFLTCGLGRNIYSYESNTPYGPFINQQLLYTIEDQYKGSYMITYNANAHPEFTENNEILISYNVNNICPSQCQDIFIDRMHADTYRPKFIRVPLYVLDPSFITGEGSGVKIYPNPTSGIFTVELENFTDQARITIKNIAGQVILREKIVSQKQTFELQDKGTYYITVSQKGKDVTHRLIVQ